MIEQLLAELKAIDSFCSVEEYKQKICQAVARFCLIRFIKAPELQNEFVQQIVFEAQKLNPDFSVIRLSVFTGLDRRIIKSILNNERTYCRLPKEDIVMNYLKTYCQQNQCIRIKKRGEYDSFQYYYMLAANGGLTASVIAAELIAQGKIIDEGKRYKLLVH